MDGPTIAAGAALLAAGFLLGRWTAPRSRTETVVYDRAPSTTPTASPRAAGAGTTADEQETIESYLREGKKIEAIKVYRERHGSSLRDAKDAVEAIEARLPRRS